MKKSNQLLKKIWDTPKAHCPKQTKKWTRKNGSMIRICDMKNIHLLNAIKIVQAQAKSEWSDMMAQCYATAASLHGEMATYYADQSMAEMERDYNWKQFLPPIFKNLEKEAERRYLVFSRF